MNVYLILENNQGHINPLAIASSLEQAFEFSKHRVECESDNYLPTAYTFREVENPTEGLLKNTRVWWANGTFRVHRRMSFAEDWRQLIIHEFALDYAYPNWIYVRVAEQINQRMNLVDPAPYFG